MIVNRWVFRDEYAAQILHRESELEALADRLEPALYGREADCALIDGPSGVGKSSSTRFMLRRINQRRSVEHATIECSGSTCHGVIHQAIVRHPTAAAVHPNSPTDDLVRALRRIVDEPYVVVLDEADTIPSLECLDDLLRVRGVSVVAVTHDAEEWLSRLGPRASEAFQGSAIAFGVYDDRELVDIMKPRRQEGLVPGVVDDDQLEAIAYESEGRARTAILSLLSAAELAEERGHDCVLEADVADCFARAEEKMRRAALDSLPPAYQGLYELVRGYGPDGVRTTELKSAYEECQGRIFAISGREPVGWARARDYLEKLCDYDLVEAEGKTVARTYTAADTELASRLDIRFGRVEN